MKTASFVIGIVIVAWFVLSVLLKPFEGPPRTINDAITADASLKRLVIDNCSNSVRRLADAQTVQISNGIGGIILITPTDNGFMHTVFASDASTRGNLIQFLCYTDSAGQVVRVIRGN